ncbi:transcription initiation factor IIB [Ceratocystis pirilliformis]|uniref:Transcription initiation factor IIB n=1 Tax=Ceratocystis pirilliformis TaxID=259994 RepID=A0ABR3YZF3_9PEZI
MITGYQQDLSNQVMCPDCQENPPNLVEEFSSGDMVCATCGLVVGEKIVDTRSEWRTFANDDQGSDDPSRVGDAANPLLNGSQLETSIAMGETRGHRQLARMQNNTTAQDKATKNLLAAYKEIGNLCDAINTGKNVSDAAKHIYKLADDRKFMKGKPQEVVIAGCIFIACRQASVPRTFREVFNLTNVSKKEIGRTYKQLEAFLAKVQDEPGNSFQKPTFDNGNTSTAAESLCARYCTPLAFRNSMKIENISRTLAARTSGVSDLAGRSPLSIAASCIYMAAHFMGEPRTSRAVAEVAGVSDGTVKTAYRFLYAARQQIIDPEWLKSGGKMENLPTVS